MYFIKNGTEFGEGILFCKRKFDFPFGSNDSRRVNDKIHLHIEWKLDCTCGFERSSPYHICLHKKLIGLFFSFFQTTTSQNARFVNVWIACSVFTSAPTVHSTQCALIFVTRIRFWLILGLICIEVNEKNASQWAEKITHQNVRYQRYSDGFPLCRPLFCGYDICSMDLA